MRSIGEAALSADVQARPTDLIFVIEHEDVKSRPSGVFGQLSLGCNKRRHPRRDLSRSLQHLTQLDPGESEDQRALCLSRSPPERAGQAGGTP
jgi:hypothetical protein